MKNISEIKQNTHGGDILAIAGQLDCHPSELLDLSSNLSPFGLIPDLTKELAQHLDDIAFLPEIDNRSLLDTFERKYNLKQGQVLAGNGTTEFIFSLPETTMCKQALIVTPTYSDYQRACDKAGIATRQFKLDLQHGFCLNPEALQNNLNGGELVFICNPNNPTGHLIKTAVLYELIMNNPDSTFLVDESYLPFVQEKSLITMPIPDNLYVLSSASKIYGMPGLRLGYLVSTKKNLTAIAAQIYSWSVNRLAQVAGKYLLEHGDQYIDNTLRYMKKERPLFVASLNRLPQISVIPGEANFVLCRLNGTLKAAWLRQKLLSHKIIIRDCSNFDNLDDQYFRVSLKDEATNRFFLNTLQEVLA